jgi:hypothetical protein
MSKRGEPRKAKHPPSPRSKRKGDLLDASSPTKRKVSVAGILKAVRQKRKLKATAPIDDQPPITDVLQIVDETVPTDVVADVPPVVNDPNVDQQEKEDVAKEETAAVQELSRPVSPPHLFLSSLDMDEFEPNTQERITIEEEFTDMLMWINDAKLFNDLLPRQWYFKWAWTTKLKDLRATQCLWQGNPSNTSILKIMYGNLQALFSVVIPELVKLDDQVYQDYTQRPDYAEKKFFIMETSVKLCLFAAFKMNDVDLMWRLPMLDDYMSMMGLVWNGNQYYDRLMHVNLSKNKHVTRYCYVMTTAYDSAIHHVHWTEGLSYTEHWVEDHLSKMNLLIHNHVRVIAKERGGLPPNDRGAQLDYFFSGRFNTCCVMYLDDNQVTDCLLKRRFLYGNVKLDNACTIIRRPLILPSTPSMSQSSSGNEPPPSMSQSSLEHVQDIYYEMEVMYEGIDQRKLVDDYSYLSVVNVREDDIREERMKLLHTPEQLIKLSSDVLVEQFRDKQSKYFPEGLRKQWEDIIIGKTNK